MAFTRCNKNSGSKKNWITVSNHKSGTTTDLDMEEYTYGSTYQCNIASGTDWVKVGIVFDEPTITSGIILMFQDYDSVFTSCDMVIMKDEGVVYKDADEVGRSCYVSNITGIKAVTIEASTTVSQNTNLMIRVYDYNNP